MDYFNYCHGLTMTNGPVRRALRRPAAAARSRRSPSARWTSRQSIQAVTEEIVLRLARHARELTGKRNLCLAGGVALNCVANGVLLREGIFDDLWIQPAAGDAGGALGAALVRLAPAPGQAARHRRRDGRDAQQGSLPRPRVHAPTQIARVPRRARAARTSELDGRAELGDARRRAARRREGRRLVPGADGVRPAGARRPLDPRRRAQSPTMQSTMNLKIKFRESFRPFAPSVLRGAGARLLRPRPRRAPTCCWSPPWSSSRRVPKRGDERDLAADRAGQPAALGHPRGHPRRLLGAHPDGATRSNPRYHACSPRSSS